MTGEFKYDVAISFLWEDKEYAEELAEALHSGLSVYVASREKEETLGTDGVDHFRNVFAKEARLSVILHRKGWAETKMTAVEELGIKDRAYETHMTSMVVIPMDDAPLRSWIPKWHIYALSGENTMREIAAVVRARAAEVGAVAKVETAGQKVIRQAREADARRRREDRMISYQAVGEIKTEIAKLAQIFEQEIAIIAEERPELNAKVEAWDYGCLVATDRGSVSLRWHQRVGNNITGAALVVTHWAGRAQCQLGGSVSGPRHHSNDVFEPHLGESDEWVWRARPDLNDRYGGIVILSLYSETYTAREFADHIIDALFRRIYDEE